MPKNALIIFRNDLRIKDNPTLNVAIKNNDNIIALFVLDEESEGVRKRGGASKWFLHHALESFGKSLEENYNIKLLYKKCKTIDAVKDVLRDADISNIYISRAYEQYNISIETDLAKLSEQENINFESHNASLLVEPWEVKNGDGNYYKVYTHFYKKALKEFTPREVERAADHKDSGYKASFFNSLKLEDLNLLPKKPDWGSKMKEYWDISEKGAENLLYSFFEKGMKNYANNRNFADDENSTSKLSPYLHFGIVSPHQLQQAAKNYTEDHKGFEKGAEKFINEIYWREFSYNLLYNFPNIANENFRPEFDNFPWEDNEDYIKKWQYGKTGYPIVDAGMRQLYETGWMHNRVRMIVGSFLTKNLLCHWKNGEDWFWDCLIDADSANNTASWQWVAGCGADAAPYFRIFNPITQGKKFDPSGDYVRKWIPELKDLPKQFLHNPWEATEMELKAAGIELGDNYPRPINKHPEARNKALQAYEKIKKG